MLRVRISVVSTGLVSCTCGAPPTNASLPPISMYGPRSTWPGRTGPEQKQEPTIGDRTKGRLHQLLRPGQVPIISRKLLARVYFVPKHGEGARLLNPSMRHAPLHQTWKIAQFRPA